MNRASKLIGVGLAAAAANQISGDTQTGVVAAGTTQGTATPIYGDTVQIATTPASSGVILGGPQFAASDSCFVYNSGANACLIYPPSGAQINALGANVGFSLATVTGVVIVCAGLVGGVLQFYTR
jgi:hypothetical protein